MATITPFSEPVFYDKIAQEINTAFNGKFDDMYGVCFPREEEGGIVPEIYKNDGSKEVFRVMPDKDRSLSFFTVAGGMVELEESHFAIPMSFFVWVNLQEYDDSKPYDYTSELIRDCYNVLNKYGCDNMTVDVNTPFEQFTQLAKDVDANIMRPFSGFRIDFTKNTVICV